MLGLDPRQKTWVGCLPTTIGGTDMAGLRLLALLPIAGHRVLSPTQQPNCVDLVLYLPPPGYPAFPIGGQAFWVGWWGGPAYSYNGHCFPTPPHSHYSCLLPTDDCCSQPPRARQDRQTWVTWFLGEQAQTGHLDFTFTQAWFPGGVQITTLTWFGLSDSSYPIPAAIDGNLTCYVLCAQLLLLVVGLPPPPGSGHGVPDRHDLPPTPRHYCVIITCGPNLLPTDHPPPRTLLGTQCSPIVWWRCLVSDLFPVLYPTGWLWNYYPMTQAGKQTKQTPRTTCR